MRRRDIPRSANNERLTCCAGCLWAGRHAADRFMAVALSSVSGEMIGQAGAIRLGVREKNLITRKRRWHLHERLEPGIERY
jgi:hypothetical protein